MNGEADNDEAVDWRYGSGLFPQHADLLRASRVPPERAPGRYVSVDTKVRLENLGIAAAGRNVPGLLITWRDKDRQPIGFQFRPDNPRKADRDKVVKYETPVGQANRIDVPAGVGPLLGDPSVPLWITEGSRKADAAAELGLACVSIAGVWSWRGRNAKGGTTAIADFEDIALNGRQVVLAFDSDVIEKKAVQKALTALARYLSQKGATVRFLVLPGSDGGKVGLDDHIADGATVEDLYALVRDTLPGCSAPDSSHDASRNLILTPASAIPMEKVRWLWDRRIPVGELSLVAGREGLGKSTFVLDLAARITRGTLGGEFFGQPRAVFIVATEDSWASTLVPRLRAANADLELVFRVETESELGIHGAPDLPRDVSSIESAIAESKPALIIFDPLMSRLSAKLDTHKDGEVRQALEPLMGLAHRTGVSIIGLMHFNKSATADPLNALMGSRAFGAAARSVSVVIRDPDDPERRVFGTPKNNLGPDDLSPISFRVIGYRYEIDGEEAWTSRIQLEGALPESIPELMARAQQRNKTSHETEAATWLRQYLARGVAVPRKDVIENGQRAGFSEQRLQRAAKNLDVVMARQSGFQGGTTWQLGQTGTGGQSHHPSGVVSLGDESNDMNEVNGEQSSHSSQSLQSTHPPRQTAFNVDPAPEASPAAEAASPPVDGIRPEPPPSRVPRHAPGRPFGSGKLVPRCRHRDCRQPRLLGGIVCETHLGHPLDTSTSSLRLSALS